MRMDVMMWINHVCSAIVDVGMIIIERVKLVPKCSIQPYWCPHSGYIHALDDHHKGQGHFTSALPHVPDTVTTWYPQSMRQFSGLYLLCQNWEVCVSECLDEWLPRHRQPLQLQPLLQDPHYNPFWPSTTLIFNDAHLTACLVIEKEDPKCEVVVTCWCTPKTKQLLIAFSMG